jgi:hypothetical protein
MCFSWGISELCLTLGINVPLDFGSGNIESLGTFRH